MEIMRIKAQWRELYPDWKFQILIWIVQKVNIQFFKYFNFLFIFLQNFLGNTYFLGSKSGSVFSMFKGLIGQKELTEDGMKPMLEKYRYVKIIKLI